MANPEDNIADFRRAVTQANKIYTKRREVPTKENLDARYDYILGHAENILPDWVAQRMRALDKRGKRQEAVAEGNKAFNKHRNWLRNMDDSVGRQLKAKKTAAAAKLARKAIDTYWQRKVPKKN